MKGFLILLLLIGIWTLSALSLYQIQFTTNPGIDNTYPSPYAGKSVTVQGIVTAIDYKSGGFFISEPSGGAWRGIYIRANSIQVATGDKIIIKGTVAEYYGMTCLQDIKNVTVIDKNHPIPLASIVTTGQITSATQAEEYESTLVKVQNSTSVQKQAFINGNSINDGSGACLMGSSFYPELSKKFTPGVVYSSLSGIVCYSYGTYSINPRIKNDVVITVPVYNQNRSWGRIKSIYK
ncbi:MAG: hypothetical protein FJ041_02635 [Candidatus Cloacimonetes bacterium]|nr:hypothetical protein [Candidatus Cloacimonadota bacterium]